MCVLTDVYSLHQLRMATPSIQTVERYMRLQLNLF